MKVRNRQPIRWGLVALAAIWMLVVVPLSAMAAPYAEFLIDARSGKVLKSVNADTRLHPASLTKMMTLYIVFEAIENGEISLDTMVTISKQAANEPPSKLGLKAGQKIKLRYLVRAAAVKSANDAATALAEAIEGSEARFARRMNRTARALGMTRSTFKNANGLTEAGHLSTARDMTNLGRHLFYDYPDYYNLFSRITADAGGTKVLHTNRRLLKSYRGADGIKTGYTRAAGFNLVASARRGNERVIATVFGGRSTPTRNARIAELLDLGFRKSPTQVALNRPSRPAYMGKLNSGAGKTVRLATATAVKESLRPQTRPNPATAEVVIIAVKSDIEKAIREAQGSDPETTATPPEDLILASVAVPAPEPVQQVVTRISTSGGRYWGINVGRYPSQYKARSVLMKTALNEMTTLDGSLRKVVQRSNGFDANFMGLTRETADLACRRLQAKKVTCFMIGPG